MEVGLLWFDNDPKVGLEEKIRRAAVRYAEKFGRPANLCVLNPATLGCRPATADGLEVLLDGRTIKVLAARQVLPHHFWVGVATAP